MATPETTTRPWVLLISLSYREYFDELQATLLSALHAKANVQCVKVSALALTELSRQPAPSAVLITDEGPAIRDREHTMVWDAVLEYIRQGGTTVIMGHFSSFVLPFDMREFFGKAGLPWQGGWYQFGRTKLQLNPAATTYNPAANLVPEFSQKALCVDNVALSDSWYTIKADPRIQSEVSDPDAPGQAPVAFARVGNGMLGYVGDVSAETGSDAAILAMCGLSGGEPANGVANGV
ncbi:hypothetical protein QQX98_002060 [Neonectria punicea]|uniref:ThuA-like domain-containing protein n=1 Tax=Neonectria punicea TaxID=979145 RepID=A0ABR1HLJ4_9HYPO